MGPTTYGAPEAADLMTDPSKVNAPGIDRQMQQVRTMAGQQQGRANNAAMAALQRAGVGGGSESSNALGNIAGQTAAGTGQALSGLENQQYGQQLGLMDALNQAKLQKYGVESQNYNNEQGQRANQVGQVGSGLAEALAFLAMM